MDMHKAANFCDYFVICTATSGRQAQAIAEGVEDGLAKIGVDLRHKQGLKSSNWILLDMGDVVVHIFEKEAREFYGLEYLWQDAPRLDWKD